MLFDSDEDDTNSIKPTDFDVLRLEAMDVGDKLDGELGNWRVFRYKSGYHLFLLNSLDSKEFEKFQSLDDLVSYLKL